MSRITIAYLRRIGHHNTNWKYYTYLPSTGCEPTTVADDDDDHDDYDR
jgi:hypothetical protein